jgi:hypothetical protein
MRGGKRAVCSERVSELRRRRKSGKHEAAGCRLLVAPSTDAAEVHMGFGG